jgi:phosphonate transport system substrate-binding protein
MRLNRQQVRLEAIVAPVMQAKRYQDLPIYFADVIIRADSGLRDFDLRDFDQWTGRVFCYNDAGSNSGYNLIQQYLAKQGYGPKFMARSIASGSHQTSIAWVVEGKADWAAIDSTVLEQEFRDQPWLKPQLRVVKSLGPCPIPPIAVAAGVSQELKQQIQAALLQPDAILLTAMHRAGIGRYVDISLLNYQGLERNEP